jgi:hypothetical protein
MIGPMGRSVVLKGEGPSQQMVYKLLFRDVFLKTVKSQIVKTE